MRNNRLHTPVGVRDILPEECAVKEMLLEKIRKVFKSYHYEAVESPMFEYIEVFSDEKRGSTDPKQMYRFFDSDGSTLALRSDMTPPIARITATAYADWEGPLRFCYYGNAFRCNESYQGKLREFSQAGVELLGVNSVLADAEVLAVAVKSLLSAGLQDFKITIGQVEFFNGIMEESGLAEEVCKEIMECIASRDYVAAEALIKYSDMPESSRELLLSLPNLVGSLDVLAFAKQKTNSKKARSAIVKLQELYRILKCYHIEAYISFDLGMVNQLNYYTGVIFRGYTYGTGYTVVDGGRYDNLISQYGKDCPAVGFSLKISGIMSALSFQGISMQAEKAGALIAFTEAGQGAALLIADKYRKSGMYLETSLLGGDLDKNIAYAEKKSMSHVLYFIDDEIVKVISLKDEMGGYTVTVPIEELVLPKEGEKA